jgi:hypothetical protein
MGLHMAGGSAPYFLAPLMAAGLVSFRGWRGTRVAPAAPTLVFGLLFYRILGRLLEASGVNSTEGPSIL